MVDWSDGELVRSAQGGNAEAFGILFERYKDSVYRALLPRTENPDEAEEFTAEAFRRAYQALPKQDRVENFGGWVYTIGKNAFLDEERKRSRRGEVSLEADVGESETWLIADPDGSWQPEAVTREEAIRRLVWEGMALLPYAYRIVLTLSVKMGLRPEEIARQVGVKRGTVDTRLSRARRLMEENVTLLILSRVGRRACPKLDDMLKRVDLWQLVESQRRGLLRHIERCEACQETRRRYVSAGQLLTLVPMAPVPASLTVAKVVKGSLVAKAAESAGSSAAQKVAKEVTRKTAQKAAREAARSGARGVVKAAAKGWGGKALVGAVVTAAVITAVVFVARRGTPPTAPSTRAASAVQTALDGLSEVESYSVVGRREDQGEGESAVETVVSAVNGAEYSCVYETGLGVMDAYVVDGRYYAGMGGMYEERDPQPEELENGACLGWLGMNTADVMPRDVERNESWYGLVGREEVNGRVGLHYRAEVEGEFDVTYTIAGMALDWSGVPLTCEGTDELWVDEEGGFLLRHNVELACRAGDGRAWSTRQSIEVTGVGEEQAIARPEGAG